MLKHGDVNPLCVFGLRRMEHCPPHFEKVPFELKCNEKKITDWVWENLEGRFWFGDHYFTDNTEKIAMQRAIAFEQHSEASYFTLMLDQINAWDLS